MTNTTTRTLAIDIDAGDTAYLDLADRLIDHIDEMPSGEDGSAQEQYKESLRARLDVLLDAGADLTEFADIVLDNADDTTAMAAGADALHDLSWLDTDDTLAVLDTDIVLLDIDRPTALATARVLAAEALFDITGRVAR